MSLDNTSVVPFTGGAYEIEQSLRFNDDDSAYLSWTPSSAGNRKTWTWSGWIKGGATGTDQTIFTAENGSDTASNIITMKDTGAFQLWQNGNTPFLRTSALYRDSSAWYHLVIAMDTTQATASNRVKFYVNGEQVTDFSNETYPTQNQEPYINSANRHDISNKNYLGSNSEYLNGYLAEVNFIDGQALDPTYFGETGTYGEWKPKEYSGTYGTNGFYLPFKQDYTVEGFSAVTYTGNGSTQYIGGTGFQPDLVWVKRRDSAEYHVLNDSVRGIGSNMYSNVTNYEDRNGPYISNILTDGFSVGSSSVLSASGGTYVGWCWDMGSGSYGLPYTISATNISHSTAQSKIGSSSIDCTNSSDGYLEIADDALLDFPSDLTIEFWMRPTGTDSSWQGIVDKGTDDDNRWYFAIPSTGTGTIGFNHSASSEGGWASVLSLTSTTSVALNTWYHIALVRLGNSWRLYVDGTLEAETNDDRNWSNNSANLNIGRSTNGAENYFNGYLDEIRFSNKARYTDDFTPSTTAFSNDDNTVLLIHSDTTNGSTTFTDSSGAASNTNGSITSYVKANPTYGQSIVSWTGTGSNDTVGHGLSSTPELIIVKNRDYAANWVGWTSVVDSSWDYFYLNKSDALGNAGETAPTSTVFSPGGGNETNKSGDGMIAYCFHSVSGYSKIGSYSGTGSDNTISGLGFKPAFLLIKGTSASREWVMLDNTRDSFNPGVRYIYASASSAEGTGFDVVDFNSDGFMLHDGWTQTNNSGETYIYMAFADNREFAYWLDQSGNNNDWTSNNLTESDIAVDSPTNNFATLNPLNIESAITLKEGNLKCGSSSSWDNAVGTMGLTTGKFYYECLVASSSAVNSFVGISKSDVSISGTYPYNNTGTLIFNGYTQVYRKDGTTTSYGTSTSSGDIIGVAVDVDAETVNFYINNIAQGSISFQSSLQDKTITPFVGVYYSDSLVLNFGQDSSFAGNKTAQGNTDSNEIGDFYYTPPSGYLALCTANLPDPDVIPSEHFNTVLYTGTGTTNSVTGVGFQPDFSWFKARNLTNNHTVFDAVRGAGVGLFTNLTNSEISSSTYMTSFDVDGFTVETSQSTNGSGDTYVAWNWKANGSGSSNTNGYYTSTVSANQDAGFSIIKWTGDGTAGGTVGHGLTKAPELWISRRINTTDNWLTYFTVVDGSLDYMYLNLTNASSGSGITLPTSTVFSDGLSTGTSDDRICYAFHSVDGFSKVGSYTGNGSSDGPFVYTGFRPAFVLWKNVDDSGHWIVHNNKTEPYNPDDSELSASTSNAESGGAAIDMLSNGFKFRGVDGLHSNTSGDTFIYMAFADNPFKYTNAR